MTVTLVTGANKGLGRETARRLIKEGHTVYLGARSVEQGQAAASELGGQFVQLGPIEHRLLALRCQVLQPNQSAVKQHP